MNKQVLVALLVCTLAATVYTACTERKENGDLLDDVKCGLSSAKDKVEEVLASDTVQDSYSYVKNKTSIAADTLGDAAKKTGSFLSESFSSLWDKTKSGYNAAKEAIQGKKDDEITLPTPAP